MQVVRRLDTFEPRHEGAFQGYVRQALLNRIRDAARLGHRRGVGELINSSHPTADPSPLEHAIGQEAFERYQAAMGRLRNTDRQAIIARVELGLPYAQVAVALGKPNIAATHVAVSRALVRLAKEMAVRSTAPRRRIRGRLLRRAWQDICGTTHVSSKAHVQSGTDVCLCNCRRVEP